MAKRGVNKVILVGNLGNDPETKYTAQGAAITNVSLATSESWTDKQTGQKQERTEWHRVVFFGKLAEIAGEYLRKGSKIYIEGALRTNKWQDQNGADRYSVDIVANEMQMLDTRSDNQGGAGQYAQQPQQPQQPQQAPQQPRQQQQGPAQSNQYAQATGASNQRTPPPPPQGMEDLDDGIPF